MFRNLHDAKTVTAVSFKPAGGTENITVVLFAIAVMFLTTGLT